MIGLHIKFIPCDQYPIQNLAKKMSLLIAELLMMRKPKLPHKYLVESNAQLMVRLPGLLKVFGSVCIPNMFRSVLFA